MTVVIGASELLLEGPLEPEQRAAAENVHRSGQQLLGVIDQMLSDVTEEAPSLNAHASADADRLSRRARKTKSIACCSRRTTSSIAR